MNITRDILISYLYCPYKAYLKSEGNVGVKSDYEHLQNELYNIYYSSALETLLKGIKYKDIHHCSSSCLTELKKKRLDIANCILKYHDFEVRFELLKLEGHKTKDADIYYFPVAFLVDEKIGKEQKLLITMMSIILGYVQKQIPVFGKLVYGRSNRVATIRTAFYQNTAKESISEVKRILSKEYIPGFCLNNHCRICEFNNFCETKAKTNDDLSLMRGMSEKEIKKQNKRGIFTVTQFSYTFRPRKRRKKSKYHKIVRHHALQALAIREQKIHVFEKPELLLKPVQIYLDIEGLPSEDYEYLIGMVIIENYQQNNIVFEEISSKISTSEKSFDVQKEFIEIPNNGFKVKKYHFWADTLEESNEIFSQFVEIVAQYDDYQLFHYGSYESKFLKRVEKKANKNARRLVKNLLHNKINALSLIYPNIYFPTYSNGLKEIGNYLGFEWSDNESSGLQAIVWRKRWEMDRINKWKRKLIIYNFEDCLCLLRIVETIANIVKRDKCQNNSELVFTDTLKKEIGGRSYGNMKFYFDELDYINKVAYFDYQREKIFIRTNDSIKTIQKKKERKKKSKSNKHLKVKSYRCPKCKSLKIEIIPNQSQEKTVYDINFFRGGLKKWLITYFSDRYKCSICEYSFYPPKFNAKRKYSYNLKAWVVYQYVFNKISFQNIEQYIYDLFGINISYHVIYRITAVRLTL